MPDAFRPLCSVLALAGLSAALAAQSRESLDDGWSLAVETAPNTLPDDGWRPVEVPGTFEDLLGAQFDGVCWYRRQITLPTAPDLVARLVCHGAATEATVFVDGRKIGTHLGAWTTFAMPLPLTPGRSATLEIRVDEKVGHNTQGFLPVIQPHFGGLWRAVELVSSSAPTLDHDDLLAFGSLSGDGAHVEVETRVWAAGTASAARLRVEVLDGASILTKESIQVATSPGDDAIVKLTLPVIGGVRPWSPDRPNLYRLRLVLTDPDGRDVLDEHDTRIGFRHVDSRGTTLLWNGRPLQLRGVLHWGYSAPNFAPPDDPARWRAELEGIRALGFNMVKACLWMPPQSFYEVADEIGLVVWQEYPTWHPDLTAPRLPQLKQEYEELHRHDRSHVSVALRSLTCETGHSAELGVIRTLFDRCKELVPNTLLVDDSAWISWHRIHDFWDDHPYGNNSWWPGKLTEIRDFVATRRALPILFGECIAADTWLDLDAWDRSRVPDDAWWAPWGLPAQREFARFVSSEYGSAEAARLLSDSLGYALRNRKYQIERLRTSLPDAGYTVSVVRDFTKARMGLWDDFGRPKWSAADWDWQRDTMITLDVTGDKRAFNPGRCELPLRVVHSGRGDVRGALTLRIDELGLVLGPVAVDVAEGRVGEPRVFAVDLPQVRRPRRVRIDAWLDGDAPARNRWDLWIVPSPRGTLPDGVRVVEALDVDTLDFMEQGGRVLLRAKNRKHCLKTDGLWFLQGAPLAPPHAIHAAIPPELLRELQSFDLERGEAMLGDQLIDQVDPVLLFWDTHDKAELRTWLMAFTTQVGSGRLAATTLADDGVAGRAVLEALADCLVADPLPTHALSATTLARLRGELTQELLELRDFEIALDPTDRGRTAGYARGEGEGAEWKPIRAGAHWESQGFEHYDGVAWYRIDVDVPADWAEKPVTAVFEGVDDSYELYLDGRLLGSHGDPATGETVWLRRTTVDLSAAIAPGTRQRLVLRVVDHVGAGGINKPCWLTTGPVDSRGDLLR